MSLCLWPAAYGCRHSVLAGSPVWRLVCLSAVAAFQPAASLPQTRAARNCFCLPACRLTDWLAGTSTDLLPPPYHPPFLLMAIVRCCRFSISHSVHAAATATTTTTTTTMTTPTAATVAATATASIFAWLTDYGYGWVWVTHIHKCATLWCALWDSWCFFFISIFKVVQIKELRTLCVRAPISRNRTKERILLVERN